MGLKGVPVIDEPLGMAHRVIGAEHGMVGNAVHPARPTGQRPALGVSGTGVAGPPGGVSVTVVHSRIMADINAPWSKKPHQARAG